MNKNKTQDVFFCSAASRYFKESIHGTAANYNGFILLEHFDPFPEKINAAHFDPQFISGLQDLAKRKKAKLLLIRNRKSNTRSCNLLYVDCVQQRYLRLNASRADVAAIRLEYYMAHPGTIWEIDPFFVVCTNGKKDKCCAKFGFPVFKFIENHDAAVPVFESTHVGGDRFAANVVCMPTGIYYGRVMVEDVDPILEAMGRKEVYYPNYRGSCTRSFFHQSIECLLREELNDFSLGFTMEIESATEEAANRFRVVAATATTRFQLVIRKETIPYPYLLTCKASKAGAITKYLAEAIEAI
ncbi:MAG: sucrase ferredoxin [Niabella sp.]|nr:sucrase ferredoxin [Niabella sp.]